jgi:hypothetical protein
MKRFYCVPLALSTALVLSTGCGPADAGADEEQSDADDDDDDDDSGSDSNESGETGSDGTGDEDDDDDDDDSGSTSDDDDDSATSDDDDDDDDATNSDEETDTEVSDSSSDDDDDDSSSDDDDDSSSDDETTDSDTETLPMGFTKNIRITDDTSNDREQSEMAAAAGPGGLVVAGWLDYRSTLSCGFSYSTDKGETWSKNWFIGPKSSGIAGDPAAAIDDEGNMYVGCQDYSTSEIVYQWSSDRGETWSDPKVITDSIDKPQFAARGDGELHLTWIDGRYRNSKDHGVTWGKELPIGGVGQGTAIGLGNTGLVHIGYHSGGNLRYVQSKDFGGSVTSAKTIADMGSVCFSDCFPRNFGIVGGGSDPTGQIVAFTWGGNRSGSSEDVWVITSADGGETWNEPQKVNDDDGSAYQVHPWAAVDNAGQIHVAWTDLRKGATTNSTMYARSPGPGEPFEANIEITDSNEGKLSGFYGDYKPLMVYGNDVYAIWSDPRDGGLNVYFSRGVGMAKSKKYDEVAMRNRPKGPIVGEALDLNELAKEHATSFQRGDAWFFPKPAAFVTKPANAFESTLATVAVRLRLHKYGAFRAWLSKFDTRSIRVVGKSERLAPRPKATEKVALNR